jgi:hypothetical protein
MIRVNVTQQTALREAELVFAQEIRSALQIVKAKLIGDVREKMREDTGAEKRNVKGKVSGSLFRLTLEIYGDKPQTLVDEFGRKPGAKMPPFKKGSLLFGWVGRKLRPPKNKHASVAFLVASKIARDGIKPNKPFEQTEKESVQFVQTEIDKALNKAVSRLNS